LRYDLYGRGLSDRPDAAYDAGLYDRQLAQLIEALRPPRPVDLVGASMGGPIAVTFAVRHPELVRTVSLFDPAYSEGSTPPAAIRWPVAGEYIMAVKIGPALAPSQRDDFLHPERYPGYFPRYREQMRYKGFRRAILSTMRHYLSRDMRGDFERLGASGKPVLLVWGRKDRDVPFETSEAVRRAVPQSLFLPVDDSAHVPFWEHAEIVNPALFEFLRAH
jgi:pimeloyl-ACP methyl ester carboxylesterase